MNNHVVSRISISLLSIVMIVFGIYHWMQPQNLLVYVPQFLPGGILWVYLVGLAFVLAAVAFLINWQVKLAGYLLALLLIIFVLTIHLPNYLHAGDKDLAQMAFINLLKDTALAAFAMHIGANARPREVTSNSSLQAEPSV